MGNTIKLVAFKLFDQRFALNAQCVDRIIQIVEINSIAKMPDYISGVINMHGEIIPVINMHILFNKSERQLELSDKLIIVNSYSIKYALWIGSNIEVLEIEEDDITSSENIIEGIPYLQGIIRKKGELIFINDVDKFISPEELQILHEAVKKSKDVIGVNL